MVSQTSATAVDNLIKIAGYVVCCVFTHTVVWCAFRLNSKVFQRYSIELKSKHQGSEFMTLEVREMLIQSGSSQPGPIKRANALLEYSSSMWMTRR